MPITNDCTVVDLAEMIHTVSWYEFSDPGYWLRWYAVKHNN